MITEEDILFDRDRDGDTGAPLVWVIDGDCLYDMPTNKVYEEMFCTFDTVLDVTDEYNLQNELVIRFIKNGRRVADFKTSEYFGSILLSDPMVLNLNDYPYGAYVMSPHAKFDGEKFIILNQDPDTLAPYPYGRIQK